MVEFKTEEKVSDKGMMDDDTYRMICKSVHEALGRPTESPQKTLAGDAVEQEPVGLRQITLRDGTTMKFLEDAKWGDK